MANPTYLQVYGNQIAVLFDDGTKRLAYPTGSDLYYITADGGGPPDDGGGPPVGGTGGFVLPFPYSSVWDYNEFHSPDRPTHDGIDFGPGLGVNGGESNKAAFNARVEFAGWAGDWFNSPGFGNLVVLDHGLFEGKSLWTLYAHARNGTIAVSTGDTVVTGQHLSSVGDTGNAIGEHLHWETWIDGVPVNPRDFMAVYGAP